jgi:hypothetical protein
MTRRIAAGLLLFMAAVCIQPRSSAQRLSAQHITATSIDDIRVWSAFVTERERRGDLQVRSTDRDPMLPSHTIERLQQFYKGVPILGSEYCPGF